MDLTEVYEELKDLKGEQFESRRNEVLHTGLYAWCLDQEGNLDRAKLDKLYFRQRGIENSLTKSPLVNAARLATGCIKELQKINNPVSNKAGVHKIET